MNDFVYWMTTLPPDQQRDPNLEVRYRSYLEQRGFSDADVDAQLNLIDEQAERSEI